MFIWTYFKRPFVMGGRVNQPTGFKKELGEELDLGKGYKGCQLVSPKGKTIIVEKQSGAIVGSSLEEVRKDIECAETHVMEEQVKFACSELEKINVILEEEFWKVYDNIR